MVALEDVRSWVLRNRWVLVLWILATAFFVYQQTTGLSWDFAVYEMNGEYLCCEGHYFEWTRPPLAPLLMIVSSALALFSWSYAGYVYVTIVSAIFGFASVKLADSFGLDRKLLYALMLSPYALNMGNFAGTELLTLALLMLGIAYIKDLKGAGSLGLAALTRYTAFIFLPLVFFQKNWKKVLASAAVIALLASPWLLFNRAEKGDALFSIRNSYALNMAEREGEAMSSQGMHFLIPVGYYLPLLFVGLYFRHEKGWEEKDLIVVVFTALAIFSYLRAPNKEPRYLFNLIFPAAYFSYYALEKHRKVALVAVTLINFILASAFFVSLSQYPGLDGAIDATGDCMAMSNLWVPMNYGGKPTEAMAPESLEELAEEGNRIALFKYVHTYENHVTPDLREDVPVLEETENYVVFGEEGKCAPEKKADRSFLEREGEARGIEKCEDSLPGFICAVLP
ncbi:MAG: glycosyltransferase 87 family protein [Candidatus Aenigmatarchaeota archaeon]